MVSPLYRLLRIAGAVLALTVAAVAQAQPGDFAERFALAADRRAALEELVPGSDDYFYYSCLQRQHEGAFAAVTPLLDEWVRAHGRSARTVEIEHRQALLTFDGDPAATYDYLRRTLGVTLDAQRRGGGPDLDLPTELDPALLAQAALDAQAMQASPGELTGFTQAGLRRLATTELDASQLLSLLDQLERPDVANLPALVARGLALPGGGSFGKRRIHDKMLLAQLEELVRLDPRLLGDRDLITAVLRRLRPSADVDWQRDAAARLAYLERLQAFVDRLPPAQASLQLHVRHHRLQYDLEADTLDRDRFLAYLSLPRPGANVAPEHRRRNAGREADAFVGFSTGLGQVGDDAWLVRAYLARFFAEGADWQPFAPYLEQEYLERLHAETRLLLGIGDPARCFATLGPEAVEALQRRVEFRFAGTQPSHFDGDAPVVIEADVKNIDQLLVKVFAIDTYDYERERGERVDAGLDLDGLIANAERSFSYDAEPLRRVRRRFEFPELVEPGTYVIEFLGGGLASRAVIRKGRLDFVSRVGAAGHVLTVLDERGEVVPDATVWCAGREYAADDSGAVAIPFAPERRASERLVLRRGRLTALTSFVHEAESYDLDVGAFVPREMLLAGARAKLLVRSRLTVNGVTIPVSLLEDPELVVTARDLDGVETVQTVRDIQLTDGAELVHEFTVPQRLRSLHAELRGEVAVVSTGRRAQVRGSYATFEVNGITETAETDCLLLGRDGQGYYVEARGRNGEPFAGVGMRLWLATRDHVAGATALLRTGDDGRARLGALAGVTGMAAQMLERPSRVWGWQLEWGGARRTRSLTGTVGTTLRLPYVARGDADGAALTLLEVRGDEFFADASSHAALRDGLVELTGLSAGDYRLWLPHDDDPVVVQVTAGAARAGWAVGRDRALELPHGAPLQIRAATVDGDALTVRLLNAGRGARVHVFSTRYPTTYDPLSRLQAAGERRGASRRLTHPTSIYRAGRQISDEYRYVLDRRFRRKFPGNMLRRPGLLLNPWRLEPATDFDSDQWNSAVGLGGGAGGRGGGRSARALGKGGNGDPVGEFADLDFLPGPAPLLTNLRADDDGVVRVPLADLGDGHLLHIVAIDGDDTAYRTARRAEPALASRDRRLTAGLDPAGHFTEQRRVEFVAAGATVTVEDAATAEVVRYGSLAQAFELLHSLSGDDELPRFAWLMRWPSLSDEDRLRLYSEHACHEVHFFLYHKDRAFFDRVVRPYLRNKLDKTFLDHWLLGDELSGYTRPWAFAQLNVVERILLTRRLPALREAGARRVGEQAELAAPDAARTAQLFRKVLAGTALELDALMAQPGRELDGKGAGPADELPPPPEMPNADDEVVEEGEAVVEPSEDPGRTAGEKDLERRRAIRPLYSPPGSTHAYTESNYWHVPIARQDGALITANGYWRDFATAPADRPFGSAHLPEATANVAEMLMALAVLDLPFAATAPTERRDGARLELTARTPLLLARRELRAAADADDESRVLIGQSFSRIEERAGRSRDDEPARTVRDEFVAGVPYECQVVLSNTGPTEQRLDLLLQIPRGAVPLRKSAATRGVPVTLAPFHTATFEYAFYLPDTGDFPHFPAHAARQSDGALLAAARPLELHVVATPTVVDTTSWPNVARDGSDAEVLAFLDAHGLFRLDLDAIAWRMRDAAFFEEVLARLRGRLRYDDALWAYGLLHGDRDAVREWLAHRADFVAACGAALQSPLLAIDPVARRSYQHVEFAPLVHARAHPLADQPVNRNHALTTQYRRLLDVLCHRPRLNAEDWMSVTCYLLQQDRVADGLEAFAKVDEAALPSRLQHDYFRCYLEFFGETPERARDVAARYRDYPVLRWRQLFADVVAQLDEAADTSGAATSTELVATEPALDLSVDGGTVTLRYQNLERCTISCYPLDVEFAFSTAPFGAPGSGASAYVVPNHEVDVDLPADRREVTVELPERFRRSDVLVEATAAGITRRGTSLDNALAVQTIEGYGQLQVRHATTGRPLSKVYVKVYARLANGKTRFHKDGYTDLRGRFDYASVSNVGLDDVQRFAVLVLSEDDGAEIRELQPPR